MHTYRDAKRMAKVLENSLRERNVDITHGESLDIIAKQFGLDDWNTLSARIKQSEASDARRMQAIESWDFIGEHPTEFDYGVDDNALGFGRRSALIRYKRSAFTRYHDSARVFGTLAQTFSAVPYRGRRLEISADLATKNVSHGATIWARVDRAPGHTLAFDNLKQHSDGWLFADSGWVKRKIVLDVPAEAVTIQFGFFLKGTGIVYACDFQVNAVGNDVALTGKPYRSEPHGPEWIAPKNLDFSKVVNLIA